MGVKELRESFNAVAGPEYTAQRAFLAYETAHDAEYQIISFSGIGPNGQSFTCKSDLLRRDPNLDEEARKVAAAFLKSKAQP